jgi:leader peptidase (prepilin peptidase)/N-methyltransferase
VELAVGVLWAISAWRFLSMFLEPDMPAISPFLHYNAYNSVGALMGKCIFYWLLVALAALDAENLWLPNWITLPGIGLGFIFTLIYRLVEDRYSDGPSPSISWVLVHTALSSLVAILTAAGVVLLLRWLYGLIRHREGMGLGDVKLMALLAAWLGLPGTLLAFFIGTMLGAIAGVVVIVVPSRREDPNDWATTRLPFGTFLCIGGIVSSLWGAPIIAGYLRWAGL